MQKLLNYLIFSILIPFCLSAQPGFTRYDSILVTDAGKTLQNPWAGGLNFAQLSPIDLDQDGIKDLFVFDRTGNKINTFVNKGIPNTVGYRYDSRYREKFPNLQNWALLVDYNNDGKEDIFSYSDNGGGIKIYRNDADASGLKFTLVSILVFSNYSGTSANLYVSSVDIPAIADVDNDGDIDVLTFGLAKSNQVEFHKNFSIENYGVPDSLIFSLETDCFGKFTENAVDCGINLQSCRIIGPTPDPSFSPTDGAHAGSCLFCHDLDGDIDVELILGDLTCPTLTMLTNSGSSSFADYTNQDATFPSYDTPVNLTMFPCAYYMDVDNDNAKDLFASPNAMNISENFNSVWFYKNTGTSNDAVFDYRQSNFLQDEMIETGEGAYPVIFDYDNDGLKDLLVANYGYYNNPGPFKSKISLYRNTGTTSVPKFDLITRDFAGLSSTNLQGMVPAFGDLDDDGDNDMILGDYTGKLHHYEKQSGSAQNFVLKTANLKNSNGRTIDIGDFAFSQLVDVNRDGKKDLLVGARNGKIAYLRNIGTTTVPSFDSITNFFGKVNVTKKNMSITGYATPQLYDSAGNFRLLVGSESGYIYRYTNIDGNLTGTFTLSDSMYLNIWEGTRSAPGLGDLDNDGKPEMILGNYAGGVAYYKGENIITGIKDIQAKENVFFKIYPNPATNKITISLSSGQSIKNISVEIFDVLGNKVFNTQHTSSFIEVNTETFSSGFYFCRLSFDGIYTNEKFVIQR